MAPASRIVTLQPTAVRDDHYKDLVQSLNVPERSHAEYSENHITYPGAPETGRGVPCAEHHNNKKL